MNNLFYKNSNWIVGNGGGKRLHSCDDAFILQTIKSVLINVDGINRWNTADNTYLLLFWITSQKP